MEKLPVVCPEHVVERNLLLTETVMQYFFDHPTVLATLPDNFRLVILPDDDAELRVYNLDLLDRYAGSNDPVVFVRTRVEYRQDVYQQGNINIYAPVAACAL